MTPQEKLVEARRLITEATIDIRRTRLLESAAHACQCGHARSDHAISVSINYTQGHCMGEDCECRWFLMQESPSARVTANEQALSERAERLAASMARVSGLSESSWCELEREFYWPERSDYIADNTPVELAANRTAVSEWLVRLLQGEL